MILSVKTRERTELIDFSVTYDKINENIMRFYSCFYPFIGMLLRRLYNILIWDNKKTPINNNVRLSTMKRLHIIILFLSISCFGCSWIVDLAIINKSEEAVTISYYIKTKDPKQLEVGIQCSPKMFYFNPPKIRF